MPEGDIDPRLVLAVLLAALAVALAFFGFLHWRRRAAARSRYPVLVVREAAEKAQRPEESRVTFEIR